MSLIILEIFFSKHRPTKIKFQKTERHNSKPIQFQTNTEEISSFNQNFVFNVIFVFYKQSYEIFLKLFIINLPNYN
jgi:hypothetical protein